MNIAPNQPQGQFVVYPQTAQQVYMQPQIVAQPPQQPGPVYVQQPVQNYGVIYIMPVQPEQQVLYTYQQPMMQYSAPMQVLSGAPVYQQARQGPPSEPGSAFNGSNRLMRLAAELNEKDTTTSTADSSPLRAEVPRWRQKASQPAMQKQQSSSTGSKRPTESKWATESQSKQEYRMDEGYDPANDTEEEILSYLSSSSKEKSSKVGFNLKSQVIDVSAKKELDKLLGCKNPESSFDTEQEQPEERPLVHKALDTSHSVAQNQIYYDKSRVLIAPSASQVPFI